MYKKVVTWAAAVVFVASLFSPAIAAPGCAGGACAMPTKKTVAKAKPAAAGCPMHQGVKGKTATCKVVAKNKSGKATKCVVNGKTVKCDNTCSVKVKGQKCGKDCMIKKGKPCVCPKGAADACPHMKKPVKKVMPRK